ncbi:hypothetical protein BT96DRAFT_1016272 [Gymnopus androsaceus JB14]|uniref:Uncharacterized protein n=1 Tax=Gymnopus androsaceus JB14 TaxID=1447944 RepID=A0A6A4I6Q2_9AGAR|nr:hypothetical protein BT96DRAFT_1016272 [Gymnopus androsaceus JB14]
MAQYLKSRIEDHIQLEPIDSYFLRNRLSEAEALVQTFESRIDKLRAQISQLTSQKDAKLVEIASLRNVLAPVRRIPLEILTEIFEVSCHVSQEFEMVAHMLILTSVCVAWRKAAHATPRLWSKLYIAVKEQTLGSDFGWIKDWITRCRRLPLDLCLDFEVEFLARSNQRKGGEQSNQRERGEQLLEYILGRFCHKLRFLGMTGCPSSFLPILNLSPSSSLSSLEEVSLSFIEDDDDTIEELIEFFPLKVNMLLTAPNLRQVEINCLSSLTLFALPAAQLTSLIVYNDDDDEADWDPALCVDLLSRCKNLVSLEITPQSHSLGFSTNLSACLPVLTSLDVACFSATNILRCLTTPLLERLSLSYDGRDMDRLVMEMAQFQQRSATALLSLVFYPPAVYIEPKIITEKVIEILSIFPTISSLEIHPTFNVDPLIELLTWTESHHILPNLIKSCIGEV